MKKASRTQEFPWFSRLFNGVNCQRWEYILGIRQLSDSAGYEKVIIEPKIVEGLNAAKGHITTKKGVIGVSYRKNREGQIDFTVTVPENIEAVFVFDTERRVLTGGENRFAFMLDRRKRG